MREVVQEVEKSQEQLEFEARRDALAERLKDEETFRKCVAEIYMYLNQLDQGMRAVAQMGGPGAMLKAILGRGGKKNVETDLQGEGETDSEL